MIKIGLLTNDVASGNFGVNALSISNLIIIEEICSNIGVDHTYILFAPLSKEVAIKNNIKNVNALKLIKYEIVDELQFSHFITSGRTFRKKLMECNIVFDTSGGDSFSDIYGMKRILHQIIPKVIAITTRKPLILTPQTIGPFSKSVWEKTAIHLLKKCERVYVRDSLSYNYCITEMGYDSPIEVTDMAMVLPYEDAHKNDNNDVLRIGINISGLLYNGGYTGNNQFKLKADYKHLVDHLIGHLQENNMYEIHLIPHVITDGIESDNEACEKLIRKYPTLIYAGSFNGPIEAKNYIACMDLFIGSRMHSTIAAVSAGVPCIPLSYSRKFEGLFSSISYNECLDLRQLNEYDVISSIDNKINNITMLKARIDYSRKLIHDRIEAYKSDLGNVIEGIR